MTVKIVLIMLVMIPQVLKAQCTLKSHQDLGKEVLAELKQLKLSCDPNQVHLTFDDGPSAVHTPVLLRELDKRNIKSTFFITTTNLDKKHKDSAGNKKIVRQLMDEEHLIANHGHDHHAHDLRMNRDGKILEAGFTQEEREAQLRKSVDLLNETTNGQFSRQRIKLFRFPYGRGAMPSLLEIEEMKKSGKIKFTSSTYREQLKEYRGQAPALQTLAGYGLSHLGWNHDSNDSSYGPNMPNNIVIKDYIIKNLTKMCSGSALQVALFHDIKAMNTVAIPLMIDIGQCLGLEFVSPSQMMSLKTSLMNSGVLIPKESVEVATFENMKELLAQVMKDGVKVDCNESDKDRSCFSKQYNTRYPHCGGGGSICFEGKWYSPRDPMVKSCFTGQ